MANVIYQEIGGHVLAITDFDLKYNDGEDEYIFGGKHSLRDIAFVSTRRLIQQPLPNKNEYELLVERTVKEALHEEGHNLGLRHHYTWQKAKGGEYCPMTKGDFNKYGEIAYIRAVIDARGFRFCDECNEHLQRTCVRNV